MDMTSLFDKVAREAGDNFLSNTAPIISGDLLIAHMLKWNRSSSAERALSPTLQEHC